MGKDHSLPPQGHSGRCEARLLAACWTDDYHGQALSPVLHLVVRFHEEGSQISLLDHIPAVVKPIRLTAA